MNILFLAPFVPSVPLDGDRVRALWSLRALARKHRVFGFFLDPNGVKALPGELRSLCADAVVADIPSWRLFVGAVKGVFSDQPIGARAFFDGRAKNMLSTALMGWPVDVAHVHRLRMMPYALGLPVPCVLDATDCLTDYFRHVEVAVRGARRIYTRMELPRLARYEREWCNRARAVIAITGLEARRLKKIGVSVPIFTAPNGVDLRYWKFRKPQSSGARRLVFMGNLSYPPNETGLLWFLRRVAPLLAAADGRSLTVVGQGVTRRLLRAARTSPLKVVFKGYLGDPRPELARSNAMICPLRIASGLQNKALQGMASGLAVIATRVVARGLGAREGRDILAADGEAGFAALCRRALEEGTVFAAVRWNARKLVEKHYDAAHAGGAILAAYGKASFGGKE